MGEAQHVPSAMSLAAGGTDEVHVLEEQAEVKGAMTVVWGSSSQAVFCDFPPHHLSVHFPPLRAVTFGSSL